MFPLKSNRISRSLSRGQDNIARKKDRAIINARRCFYEIRSFEKTLRLEFKSDKKRYPDRDLVEVVVAMANTDGGEIFLGVKDNDDIIGIVKIHEDSVRLCAMVMNNIIPSLFIHRLLKQMIDAKNLKIIGSARNKVSKRIIMLLTMVENINQFINAMKSPHQRYVNVNNHR